MEIKKRVGFHNEKVTSSRIADCNSNLKIGRDDDFEVTFHVVLKLPVVLEAALLLLLDDLK